MTSTFTNPALTAALDAAATGDPRRYVITGGPSSGKDDLIAAIHAAGIPCMAEEPGREIYRAHRERLGRHLRREDRRDYSLEVLEAFIAEYTTHNTGRGSTTGASLTATAGTGSSGCGRPRNSRRRPPYRYDAIFVLDPLDTFEDPDDIVWAKDREIRRVHELIVQGYYDAGYDPVFVAPDSAQPGSTSSAPTCACPNPAEERD